MERLTDICWGNLDPWECCGQDHYCQRGCHEKGGCANGCIVPKIYSRLAAYEDTGLEPEEIEDLVSGREITPEAEYAINKHANSLIERMDALLHQDDSELAAYRALGSIAHLRELVQAEKDGLPEIGVKVVTNADRIRAMSDEELSEFLAYTWETYRAWHQDSGETLYWFQQPAEEDYQ